MTLSQESFFLLIAKIQTHSLYYKHVFLPVYPSRFYDINLILFIQTDYRVRCNVLSVWSNNKADGIRPSPIDVSCCKWTRKWAADEASKKRNIPYRVRPIIGWNWPQSEVTREPVDEEKFLWRFLWLLQDVIMLVATSPFLSLDGPPRIISEVKKATPMRPREQIRPRISGKSPLLKTIIYTACLVNCLKLWRSAAIFSRIFFLSLLVTLKLCAVWENCHVFSWNRY